MDGDDLADLEERESLVHSGSEDAGSECSKAPSEEEPPAAAAPGKGHGRGRGRGKGAGRGRGRGRGAKGCGRGAQDAAGDDAGGAPGPAPPKPSKYVWVDASEHGFSPRVEFEGEPLPKLSSKFDGLTVDSEPWEWFKVMDAPDMCVQCTVKYPVPRLNCEQYRLLKTKAPRLQAQCAGQLSLEAPEHPSGYQKLPLGPVCLITCISYGLANIGFESSNVLSVIRSAGSTRLL